MYFLDIEDVPQGMFLWKGADKKAVTTKAQNQLAGKDQRDSQPEMYLAGLVAEKMHSQQATETAKQEGNSPDSPFRDPVQPVYCIVFIHKHNHKPKGIDYKEVKKEQLHTKTFLEGINVKKCWLLLGVVFLLTGCAAQETFETISDEIIQPVNGQAQEIYLELPETADVQAMDTESTGALYFCGDMTVCVQTLDGGDLDRTLRATTGYCREAVQLLESYSPNGKSYECAWSSVGEGGLQVGRTRIIDDGSYHYTLTVMLPEASVEENRESLRKILDSFGLVTQDSAVNTGS